MRNEDEEPSGPFDMMTEDGCFSAGCVFVFIVGFVVLPLSLLWDWLTGKALVGPLLPLSMLLLVSIGFIAGWVRHRRR